MKYSWISSMFDRVELIKEEQLRLSVMHDRFASDVNKTMSVMRSQDRQIEILDQQSRRYNLRFLGIPEREDQDLLSLVSEIIERKMGITIGGRGIESAKRIDEGVRPRPVLVKFSRWKEKSRVAHKRKSLPKSMEIEDDLTDFQKSIKFQLKEIARKAEREGKGVRWYGKQLFVDGKEIKLEDVRT
uniref:uncharacterized protein LOC100181609 isoform X2 n=1 Tax=Ciona intestinalis TaxID=7719 RepID=UPI000EF4A1F9|nr:uncharacterized protein LOC100181609 isoform X2 [Ciona intestinalis]|eukprot:XP_026693328.1 uncharacterized protein LOC100181609 isoform X2 [Ciona intestinalis]